MAIGSDLGHRDHRRRARATAGMAGRAVAREDRRAARRRAPDRPRRDTPAAARRASTAPLAEALELDRLERGAVADGRADQQLVQRRVQAVPVQGRAVAQRQAPERGHVGVADGVVRLLLELADFQRIERIDAAATPVGLPFGSTPCPWRAARGASGRRDDQRAHQQPTRSTRASSSGRWPPAPCRC